MPSPLSPIIPFGEWTPDTLDYATAGCTVASNCLTQAEYYKPFPEFGYISDSLPERAIGQFSCRDTSDNVHIFAGTATGLYKLSGTTWTDVTRVSGVYTTASDGWWSFAIFGDRVIATNLADDVQSFILGSSTEFAALSGSPPKARGVTVVNNFVLLFGLDGNIQRVQWSALDDPTDWTPSAATQSDFNDILGDGGAVQGVVGSQNVAIVVMEKQIWRMDYVGPDTIFNFTLVEDKRGTPSPRSVCGDGINVYYLAENGFQLFDGTHSIPIGHNKVDKYFFARVDKNYIANGVIGTADSANKAVMFAYPMTGETEDGSVTDMLAYNYQDRRWTEIDAVSWIIGESLTASLTMEDLGTLYGTMEAVPFNLDSPVWRGGEFVLAGIDSSGRYGYFDGDTMTATIATSENQLNTGGLAEVQSVIPVTDSDATTVRIGSRMLQSGEVIYSASQMPHASTGECNFRVGARYHRAEVTLAGTWTLAQGVQFRFARKGMR